MKSRRISIALGVMFALFAFGAFNTATAEAGHWRRGRGFCGPRVIHRPAYRRIYRPVYPRVRHYDVGVYVGPRHGYGYGGGYGYGYGYGGGFGGGFGYGYGGGGFCY